MEGVGTYILWQLCRSILRSFGIFGVYILWLFGIFFRFGILYR
jgi:hypothetical protein